MTGIRRPGGGNIAPARARRTILFAVLAAAACVRADALPVAPDPLPADEHARSVACLADAIIYEAGLEPVEGQEAVAQVILNRMRSPVFPKTVCGVVYQGSERRSGCQFTFTCDGSLRRSIPARMTTIARAIAEAALDGTLPDRIADATFYHAYYVAPRWAPRLTRIGRIGAHIFYSSAAGQPIDPAQPPFGPSPQAGPHRQLASRAIASAPFAPWGLPMTSGSPAPVSGSAPLE